MSRPRMTKEGWDALSAFPWADKAKRLWPVLKGRERQAVVGAAKAEIEANRRYCIAEAASKRATTPGCL